MPSPSGASLLFALGMGIACLAAGAEVSLAMVYATAQTFGWNWGESLDPREDARFCLVYTGAILAGRRSPSCSVSIR